MGLARRMETGIRRCTSHRIQDLYRTDHLPREDCIVTLEWGAMTGQWVHSTVMLDPPLGKTGIMASRAGWGRTPLRLL